MNLCSSGIGWFNYFSEAINMNQLTPKKPEPDVSIEHALTELSLSDLNDLCDATDAAINAGGGFGWVKLPAREIMERYWQGAITMPKRDVFIARLDGVICGAITMIRPSVNNEAQSHVAQVTGHFMAPWAQRYGLARMLLQRAEQQAKSLKLNVVNLDVRETKEAAIKLYEDVGYEKYGTNPAYAYIDGHYVPGFYFMKILDAS